MSADTYRVVTYRSARGPRAGILVDDHVYDAQDLLADRLHDDPGFDGSTVLGLLRSWRDVRGQVQAALDAGASYRRTPVADPVLLAPVPAPPTVFCAGANYWDHIEEMEGAVDRGRRPKDPWFFVKTSASVVGDGVPVHGPTASRQLDWEAELAVVIGAECRDVAAAEAGDVIAGYTVVNDLSARDLMVRADRPPAMTYDWVGQKCFDGALPMGPWLTPATAVPDCHRLAVRLWVNDELKQESNTSNLVHSVFEQIEWLSHQLTLRPGDVICTGTPAGVGLPSGTFLQPGDTVRIEIEGCGTLTTPIIDAPVPGRR